MIGFAPAKINLGLFVTGIRPDGFHDLKSVFWPIGWSDILEVHHSNSEGLDLHLTGLVIDGDPTSNLVKRTYDLLRQRYSISGVTAHLHKVIPMGAGLGGGSSDGTCMLRLLNELYDLKMTDEEGESLAAELGSDCPFFWRAEPALVSGRGELLESWDFNFSPETFITVAYPGIHVSTREAFQGIVPQPSESDFHALAKTPLSEWHLILRNDFQSVMEVRHPTIRQVRELLESHGALYSQMTGTGSACFGLFSSEELALNACSAAHKKGWVAHASRAQR
ncbi:MAG TPA: 4-(cytidine 5'-diphospho)-2-C-methyl-D-erythritol kinase [Flavobacteriales bacterium]|nr:4-(cytidine 5'-diphospho)-2-C-methyl-D-erythritol kinase [Flavobacteriales bacterium]|tara:strand:- start:486 stop:1322 length:837 start_codon:yes stop_codon:yes gene_type:complete